MAEFIARALDPADSRQVVTEPDARYFGARLAGGELTPGEGARIGALKFERWLEGIPSDSAPVG